MEFTDNLQALMDARGISRRKLASGCGISPSAVNSRFNRSAENIGLPTLKTLSEYFGIGIGELVYGKKPQREITFSGNTYSDDELKQISARSR